jgi:hypothetical protein
VEFSIVVLMSQAVGLVYDNATWPQAKVKCLPSVPTALQMVLPMGLARIVAVAHSWRTEVSVNERLGLKYTCGLLTRYPPARTTSG